MKSLRFGIDGDDSSEIQQFLFIVADQLEIRMDHVHGGLKAADFSREDEPGVLLEEFLQIPRRAMEPFGRQGSGIVRENGFQYTLLRVTPHFGMDDPCYDGFSAAHPGVRDLLDEPSVFVAPWQKIEQIFYGANGLPFEL